MMRGNAMGVKLYASIIISIYIHVSILSSRLHQITSMLTVRRHLALSLLMIVAMGVAEVGFVAVYPNEIMQLLLCNVTLRETADKKK
jgi:hypothetical protein